MIIIPVYNITLAPNATLYFGLEQLKSSAGKKAVRVNEKVTIISAKDGSYKEEIHENSFYPIGVSGVITDVNEQGFVTIRTQYRVNIEDVFVNPDKTLHLNTSRRNDIQDLDKQVEEEKLKNILEEMRRFSAKTEWAESAEYWIMQIDTIETSICAVSPWIKLSSEERYAILAEDSRQKRAEMIERIMYDFLEIGRIRNEAATAQQKEYQQMYRESAIKRQIEHLQRELDEMHPENVTDVRKFEKKIAESGMNETAKKEAEKVLNRLRQEGKNSVESGMLYDYLDFVTGLVWTKEEAEYINLEEARKILEEDHYGLAKVKDRIIQQIAVMNLKRKQSGSILLFVGAPGTGKTSIGKSIARALGRKYERVSLGGVHDESDIRGHRRTYIGSMAGRIMSGIQKSGASNPVIVLDEIDKMSASFHGNPASALLEVLDPEQNNTFTDHYMNVPYDLSDVLFICTANTVDTIPEPLLNRMEVIPFNGYTPIEKLKIAKEHLVPKSMESMGISAQQMEIEDDAIEKIISEYTMEGGVRGLRKRIDTLCRVLAVKVATNPDARLRVDANVVEEVIDSRPIEHSKALKSSKPGVVTGLAYTTVGGDILYIETLLTKGKGNVQITGQLGDVMQESAKIAVSLIKSMFPDEADVLQEHDLHIHVPSGAVPKDGPSAGITLSAAIASLILGKAVDPEIAMTGEISLRGAVTPIGGLPEKLMAAQRAGIQKVLIPKSNARDLKDVSEEVKDKLTIVLVETIEDVLMQTGLIKESLEKVS